VETFALVEMNLPPPHRHGAGQRPGWFYYLGGGADRIHSTRHSAAQGSWSEESRQGAPFPRLHPSTPQTSTSSRRD
jgi:hypothetical protein